MSKYGMGAAKDLWNCGYHKMDAIHKVKKFRMIQYEMSKLSIHKSIDVDIFNAMNLYHNSIKFRFCS